MTSSLSNRTPCGGGKLSGQSTAEQSGYRKSEARTGRRYEEEGIRYLFLSTTTTWACRGFIIVRGVDPNALAYMYSCVSQLRFWGSRVDPAKLHSAR
ncbi:hypothetical protein HYQ46_002101 [Verticillium longisporum]|nr:hypothetical protein HYQ46_002101 [Verticillium longisporum]